MHLFLGVLSRYDARIATQIVKSPLNGCIAYYSTVSFYNTVNITMRCAGNKATIDKQMGFVSKIEFMLKMKGS